VIRHLIKSVIKRLPTNHSRYGKKIAMYLSVVFEFLNRADKTAGGPIATIDKTVVLSLG
jgi:hypothetical protein